MEIENNDRCFVCGKQNPFGLQITPNISPDGSKVEIACTPPDHFQGWASVIHGGILSTLRTYAKQIDASGKKQ